MRKKAQQASPTWRDKKPTGSVHNADKSGAGWKKNIKRLSWSLSLQLFPFFFSQKRYRRRAVVDFSGFNISSKFGFNYYTGEESCAHRGNSRGSHFHSLNAANELLLLCVCCTIKSPQFRKALKNTASAHMQLLRAARRRGNCEISFK